MCQVNTHSMASKIYYTSNDIENSRLLTEYNYRDDNIIDCLKYMGPIFNVIAGFNMDKCDICNVTDCFYTSRYLMNLFSPLIDKVLILENTVPPSVSNYNILDINFVGGYPYHRFLLIKLYDQWYLMNSYSGLYNLTIIPVSFEVLNELLSGSNTIHEEFFRERYFTNENCKLKIKCCNYDVIPIDKLKCWINNYLDIFKIIS